MYKRQVFVLSHIDRMPLGDMTGTLISLINANCRIDFSYNYSVDEKRFSLDTRQLRAILGSVPVSYTHLKRRCGAPYRDT